MKTKGKYFGLFLSLGFALRIPASKLPFDFQFETKASDTFFDTSLYTGQREATINSAPASLNDVANPDKYRSVLSVNPDAVSHADKSTTLFFRL